jgi:hypothetical protein
MSLVASWWPAMVDIGIISAFSMIYVEAQTGVGWCFSLRRSLRITLQVMQPLLA